MLQINDTISKQKSKTNTTKINFMSTFISLMIVIIMLLILFDPVTYSKSIIKGLSLYFFNVLPGLLPFMFFIKQLTNQNTVLKLTNKLNFISKPFGVNSFGFYAFIMSLLSGYPIGAKITSDLYSQSKIAENSLLKTAVFSSTPGLIFVVGSVGGLMLKNIKLGLYIYTINILSCIITSLLLNLFSKKETFKQKSTNITTTKQTLGAITQDTTISLLSVGFYIALFTLIIDLLTNLKVFLFLQSIIGLNQDKTTIFQGVMSGIVEMTNGIKLLSNSYSPLSLSFISAIISFSGFSIIMQSLSFLSNTKIKARRFILLKFLQSTICFFISFLFFNLL